MINNRKFNFFIDFDGTITKQDIGETIIKNYGDPEEINRIIEKWAKHEITSAESWYLFIDLMINYTQSSINNLLDTIDIDLYFLEFINFTKKHNFPILVLSDGWDYYIKYFFNKYNIDIPFYANKINFDNNNKIKISFPYKDDECNLCGNCKRNHLLLNSADDEREYTVYIGDGLSDRCPILYVDFIFAKGSLLKYLETNRISYYPFTNFKDVLNILEGLLAKKKLKKRHQALLNRKKFYLEG
ncbi:MAG TPA: MtnX-like HAD-IB family phosphatase [Ignavibacteriales bacterium]|nr:MtnX-like HAD-IB family phosphatase [Ignavibacteriales bacterium]